MPSVKMDEKTENLAFDEKQQNLSIECTRTREDNINSSQAAVPKNSENILQSIDSHGGLG